MKELKPCPFCGHKKPRVEGPYASNDQYWIGCHKCFAGTMYHDTEIEAIEAWNRRHNENNTKN